MDDAVQQDELCPLHRSVREDLEGVEKETGYSKNTVNTGGFDESAHFAYRGMVNDHQRKMARKAGKPCGYVEGGVVQDQDDSPAKPGEIATTRYGHKRHAEPAYSTKDEAGHRRAAAENARFRTEEAHGLNSYEVEAKLLKKAGEPYNVRRRDYADGGVIGAVSNAIENVGRTFGTEKAKKIKAAEESLREPRAGEGKLERLQDIVERNARRPKRSRDIEEAERKALED